jgi:hypothetical protein
VNYLNLPIEVLFSPEVLGANPTERSTWLMLLAYCVSQENSGIILGAGDWKDRKTQQILRLTNRELRATTPLWTWKSADLHVTFYPIDKQAIVQRKRHIAHHNGTKHQPTTPPTPEPISEPISAPTLAPITPPITQPTPEPKPLKGREGKGKEMEGKGKEAEQPPPPLLAIEHEIDPSIQARHLCSIHPKRALTQPALTSALTALRRHSYTTLLAGVRAYAHQVATWTEAEKLNFITNPEKFWNEDTWNQPPDNWKSRKALPHPHAKHQPMTDEQALLLLGGRAPATP